jgi:predicted anti-sigma-YlaC factor YlaD
MNSCQHYAELASQSLDVSLTFWQQVRLRIHLRLCPPCKRFRDQAIFLRQALRRRASSAPSAQPDHRVRLSESARERIRRAVIESGASGQGA